MGQPRSPSRVNVRGRLWQKSRRETTANTQAEPKSSPSIPETLLYRILPLSVSLVAQTVKRLPAMRETRVRSLGQEEPLEKEMATQYPVFLPGKFHGWRSLVGYSPWARKELDTCQSDSVPGTGNRRHPFKKLTV